MRSGNGSVSRVLCFCTFFVLCFCFLFVFVANRAVRMPSNRASESSKRSGSGRTVDRSRKWTRAKRRRAVERWGATFHQPFPINHRYQPFSSAIVIIISSTIINLSSIFAMNLSINHRHEPFCRLRNSHWQQFLSRYELHAVLSAFPALGLAWLYLVCFWPFWKNW